MEEFSQAVQGYASEVSLFSTPLAFFTVILKSCKRRDSDDRLRAQAQDIYQRMNPGQQEDFHLYARWLSAGGIPMPVKLG